MILGKFLNLLFTFSNTSDGNMSLYYEGSKKVLENRNKFFQKLGIKNTVEVKQVHSNKVIKADRIPSTKTQADSIITNKPNLYLMIKVADCIPIGLYDPANNAIGLIHAGLKGLEGGVINKTIQRMREAFRTNPKTLLVQFGPSIGPCHYRADIWKLAEDQLINYGVLNKNIENPKICTYENKDYFSHRRSEDTKQKEGRFVTILGLKNVN